MSATNNYAELTGLDDILESKPKFNKTTFFKLKEGTLVLRLLPSPVEGKKALRDHWVNWFEFEGNGGKKTFRAATLPKNSAVREKLQALRGEMDAIAAPFKKTVQGPNGSYDKIDYDAMPKDVSDKYKGLAAKANSLKSQHHYYVNAVDASGNIGILKLPKTALQALGVELKRLTGKVITSNTDAFDLDKGVWFEFTRIGKGMRDTKYTVQVNRIATTDAEGDVVEKINKTPLTKEFKEAYPTKGVDLDTLFKTLTPEEDVLIAKGDFSPFLGKSDSDSSMSDIVGGEVSDVDVDDVQSIEM